MQITKFNIYGRIHSYAQRSKAIALYAAVLNSTSNSMHTAFNDFEEYCDNLCERQILKMHIIVRKLLTKTLYIMKGFIIFFVYIVLTLIILSSLGPTTKAGMGYYAAFSTVYVSILAIIIECKEEDNEE